LKKIDLDSWNRKHHFNHFNALEDPYFAVTIPFDVSAAYRKSKSTSLSFFAIYLHDCMKAVNAVDNFKYRIIENEIFEFDVINASATLLRDDKTFGSAHKWIKLHPLFGITMVYFYLAKRAFFGN
jgi:chloramphenicol O-acetyltransferase type A